MYLGVRKGGVYDTQSRRHVGRPAPLPTEDGPKLCRPGRSSVASISAILLRMLRNCTASCRGALSTRVPYRKSQELPRRCGRCHDDVTLTQPRAANGVSVSDGPRVLRELITNGAGKLLSPGDSVVHNGLLVCVG